MEEHPEAKKIVEVLSKKGFVAYYAGGWVRDFLLQKPSDDIDIATNAPPEVVQASFKKTIPVGIAFGIVLVIINDNHYEVATFRKDLEYKDGRRPTKICFATPEEDAKRRDFTINGMFFDPMTEQVIDFVEGKKDLKKKVIRAIGDPHERIKEDRLRMIRAVRLSCRFEFKIHPETKKAIIAHAKELFPAVAIERITQELVKMANFTGLKKDLLLLHELHLLFVIFPGLKDVSLEEIEKRLFAINDFPHKTPLIAYLVELFPQSSLKEQKDLCKYLKLPNYDLEFIQFLYQTKKLLKQKQVDNYTWAHFYAHPFSEKALFICIAHISIDKRKAFLLFHEKKRKELSLFIEKIQQNDPVVRAHHLQKAGVLPSKEMGRLICEAEKISINENITEAKHVIEKLKKSPHWPRRGES